MWACPTQYDAELTGQQKAFEAMAPLSVCTMKKHELSSQLAGCVCNSRQQGV